MKLEEKINLQMKIALKSGKKDRLEVLRTIRAAIIEFNKSGAGREMNDDDEIKILNNQAKKRKDAIPLYIQGGRPEMAAKEEEELKVIEEFLPAKMSEEDVKAVIDRIITKTGAVEPKDLGKVMGAAMKELKGKADGGFIQSYTKEKLNPV
jgi:uncharacterized protein